MPLYPAAPACFRFTSSYRLGQARWDHPLDPHFRRMYLRERFGNSDPVDTKGGVLSCEPSTNTAHQATAVTAGRAAGDGATAAATHGGRPPIMLPPRRMRPSILDFPADKALQNLRARRLNVSGSSSSRSTFAAVTGAPAAAGPAALGSAKIVHVNNKAAGAGGAGHHYHSSGELWADGKGINNSRQPASPARPRRRRPVSASAVCGGLEERSLGQKAAVFEAMHPDGGELSRGESGGTGTMRHAGPQISDLQHNQRTRRGGSTSTARIRRPRSARAALQRPPPVATDYYHYHPNSNSGSAPGREKEYFSQRPLQQGQQQEKHPRPSSEASLPRAADETRGVEGFRSSTGEARAGRGGGEGPGWGAQLRFSREDLVPTGNSRGVATRQAPEEEERAWLRSR